MMNIPVIFLTASGDESSVVTGLNMGADDYITKPFRPRELIARIKNALRKSESFGTNFEIRGLYVDTASGIVKKNGNEVFLSALEYRLLLVFISNPKSIITRTKLLDELWDAAGEFVNDNTLTVYIKRLREKIENDPADPQIILTVRGTGYRLVINVYAGILSIISSAVFGIVFFMFTKSRYKSIAKISDEIDLVLHNDDHLYITESNEGELSILQSEIRKMTLRIREQNDALKKEKEHLADSLADIAHQLRTPLTSVNLILSLLENSNDENELKKFKREAEELLLQMDWLITSLLKISRLDAGIVVFKSEEIDVNKLISTALRPFLISIELHNIDLQIHVEKGIVIHGDSGWLSEALQNIFKNCIESVGDNGRFQITCENNQLFTEIVIHDSGDGFKKEDLPYLFKRFYRGKNTDATGYGIGLALCRMIITRQGGTITAKNHMQGGAVFSIHFPK